ncbi:MAG: right-handed parallel beta-helix repeat-containing protein [Candidatus Krumholzibacteria bacterium]|nr:right-handed parallel beta-helix repeat-containing protein [Candidatus Krumholzibacteria bacterium]
MFKSKNLCLCCLIMVAAVQCGLAATITVEKDGSGDFTQVQPALDAAASGDTVRIGPGEFTELIPSYIPGYAWDVEVCAYVRVPNLTIIGAGAGQTILGPTTYRGSTQTFSPKCMVWLEGNDRIVEGITFRNCYEGIHATHGPVFIDDCEFRDNGGLGVIWHAEDSGGWIRNSNFSSNILGNIGLGMLGPGSNIIIENCIFDNSEISIKNTKGTSILNCEMKNVRIGVKISAGARCILNNCNVYNCSIIGVALANVGPHCDIFNCNISGDEAALAAYAEATLFASNTIFNGGSFATLYFQNSGPAVIQNSHILRSGPYSVKCTHPEAYGLNTHDMTGNYWGTTDPDLVASWIWDQNDDPANFSIVNFLPMANGPVPTEKKSFGSVKALFR